MKKVMLVFVVTLASSTNNAFQGSQLIQKDAPQEYTRNCFLDAAKDEYVYHEDNQNDIDEYDQNVCDNVQPPKISSLEASLRDLMGRFLINCLIVKEMASLYFTEIKDTLNQWFNRLVKA